MIRIFKYICENIKWRLAGKPTRSKESVLKLFEICRDCEHFIKYKHNFGECNICGCNIKKDHEDLNFNKLSWATTKCPDNPPKWNRGNYEVD